MIVLNGIAMAFGTVFMNSADGSRVSVATDVRWTSNCMNEILLELIRLHRGGDL